MWIENFSLPNGVNGWKLKRMFFGLGLTSSKVDLRMGKLMWIAH
jgi:hypothetical protein